MHWEFVIVGYVVIFAVLALYCALVIRRGKQLSENIPSEQRRFLD